MISPVGYILIPLGLVLFLRGRRSLLWATIVSIPITIISIVDIGVTVVSGFQFFGTLFIARCVVDGLWTRNLRFRFSASKVTGLIFIAVCFFSIAMAAVKSGTVEVLGQGGKWTEVYVNLEPLQLSAQNFTQIVFPFWGFLLYLFLARELNSVADLKKSLNVLVWGAIVLGTSSAVGGVLSTIGQEGLYANVLSIFTVGPAGIKSPVIGTFGQFFRSYTLAGEPGDTSLYYLIGLGGLVGVALKSASNAGKTIPYAWPKLAFIVFALIINGSTAGYFGMFLFVIWLLLVPIVVSGRASVSLRPVVKLLLGVGILLAVIGATLEVGGISLVEWVQQYHVAKFQGEAGSGQIRRTVMLHGLDIFLKNPILGVGYGSSLSLSFGAFLISNLGLVGTGVFFLFVFLAFRNAVHVAKRSDQELGAIAFSLALILPPFMGVLLTGMGAFALNLGVTWLLLAMTEATYQAFQNRYLHA